MTNQRIFISYGRLDAVEFATRLENDLTGLGYEVWRDQTVLSQFAGSDWMAHIMQAIQNSDVVIALLTPHSVRGSADLNATADSVCLDELAAARFGDPPKPIIPIMLAACRPPLIIWRLQTIDVSKETGDEAYQKALAAIGAALTPAVKGQSEQRRGLAGELDFAPYIGYKTRNFFGRYWLLQRIRNWLENGSSATCAIIVGDPGIGKTALLAELMIRNPAQMILGAYFIRSDQPETRDPMSFVAHVDAVLSTQMIDYGEKEADFRRWGSATQAFASTVIAKLRHMAPPSGGPKAFLVDGLDEAFIDLGRTDTIPNLIAQSLREFPAWFRLLMSSRRDEAVLGKLSSLDPWIIDASGTENHEDIKGFIRLRLTSPNLSGTIQDQCVKEALQVQIEALANGNFLYASQLLDDLESGRIDSSNINQIPPSLKGMYEHFFSRAFSNPDRYTFFRQLFAVVLALQTSLSTEDLAALLGLASKDELIERIQPIEQYLLISRYANDLYIRPYHKSLADWLLAGSHPYAIDISQGFWLIADGIARGTLRRILWRLDLGEIFGYFLLSGSSEKLEMVLAGERFWHDRYYIENAPAGGMSAFGIKQDRFMRSEVAIDLELETSCTLSILKGLSSETKRLRAEHLDKYLMPIYARGGSIDTFPLDETDAKELRRALGLAIKIIEDTGRWLRDGIHNSPGAIFQNLADQLRKLALAYLNELKDLNAMLDAFSFYAMYKNYGMSGAYDDTCQAISGDFRDILAKSLPSGLH